MCALLMTWKLQYLPSLIVNYSSPTFCAENIKGTKWRLLTYVDGIYLQREKDDQFPHRIKIQGKLLYSRDNGRKVSNVFNEEIDINQRFNVGMLTKSLCFETLSIQCYLSQSSDLSPSVEYVAYTGYDGEKFSIVRNVLLPVCDNQEVQSEPIYINDSYKYFSGFEILLKSTSKNIYVTVTLKELKEAVCVNYKIELISSEERLLYAFVGEKSVNTKSSDFSHLANKENINDTWTSNLKIIASFYVISHQHGKYNSHIVSTNYPCNNALPEITQKNDVPSFNKVMKAMHVDKKFNDFTIRCRGREFQVHKVVLAAASPVFESMFDMDFAEKQSSTVDIEDIEADTVSKMIDFLYTDTLDEVEWGSCVDLYAAANKYEMQDLIQNCAQYMIKHLDVENVCEVLSMSDMHQDVDLMKVAKEFVRSQFKQVLHSNQWQNFMETNTKVACSMMYEKVKLNETFCC